MSPDRLYGRVKDFGFGWVRWLLIGSSRSIVAHYPTPVAKNDKSGVILMTEESILDDGTEDVTGNLL